MFKFMGSRNQNLFPLPYPRGLSVNFGANQKKSRLWSILESMQRRFCTVSKKTLDPQKPFLQQWNKIFVLSSVIAVAIDPIFFYVPMIDGQRQCLTIDRPLMIIACVLRSFIDIFYLLHMIFEFRTGFLPSSLRIFQSDELIVDPAAMAKRYLSSNFLIDILSIFPLPQLLVLVIVPATKGPIPLKMKNVVKIVVLLQYVPRLLRIYPLYREVTKTSGILTETAWSGAAFNLLIYLQASHVLGAIWYLLSIEQQTKCWLEACRKDKCTEKFLYCGDHSRPIYASINEYCSPKESEDGKTFNFGMYVDALKFHLTETNSFHRKFFYSFWWALRNVGSGGQALEVGTYTGEVIFAVFIAILGLVLFALLVGNIQKYLQSTTTLVKEEQMRINRRDAEHWMARRNLPKELRQRIRRYDQYKWQLNRGAKEEELLSNLPEDLRRDIKRHLCFELLKKVPLFRGMNTQLLDVMCEYLKPVLFTEKSFIQREGEPIDMMLFIMKGKLATIITYGWKNDSYSIILKAGDFCGEELVQWAMDPTSTSLPISTRTVKSLTEVEAFALKADELKFITSQFQLQRLNSNQLQLSARFYSRQWQVWAAYKIQEAWHDYRERKTRGGGDGRFQDALVKIVGASASFGATLYASIFISHLLQAVLRDQQHETTQLSRVMTLPAPPKPDE